MKITTFPLSKKKKNNCPVSMTAAFDAMQTFKKDINFMIQELKEA